jgi:hypothetical protein
MLPNDDFGGFGINISPTCGGGSVGGWMGVQSVGDVRNNTQVS